MVFLASTIVCSPSPPPDVHLRQETDKPPSEGKDFAQQRGAMVRDQLRARDIDNQAVLDAMAKVPRHEFVPTGIRDWAYSDGPLPIGQGQTISQPYIVALMTQLADPKPGQKVLEIGTGSGYQAAVLGELVGEVYTIEIVASLAESARLLLHSLECDNVYVKAGDGYQGWPEQAPFDAILVTAAAPSIPQPLLNQLKEGGKLVIPVGEPGAIQSLVVVTRDLGRFRRREVIPVRFVPMTGEIEKGP